MKRAALILLLMLVSIAPAFSQSTKKQENRRAQLQKEIAVINQQLKENAKGSSKALSDLQLTRKKNRPQERPDQRKRKGNSLPERFNSFQGK